MTPCPVAIHPERTLAEAHSLMRAHGVRHLPVVDEDRVVGVVSLNDLLLLESLPDVEPDQVAVEEAMVGHPYMVWIDTPVIVVLEQMLARRLDSVLVVDHVGLASGRVAGIFTPVDAMQALKALTSEPKSPRERN
jgi:acetoin utilization protein AcuB